MEQAMSSWTRRFIKEAKRFLEDPESSLDSLEECLNKMSQLDFGNVNPDKMETNSFFVSLWEVMSSRNGPHKAGVDLLMAAVGNSNLKRLLTNQYKFVPILAELLHRDGLSTQSRMSILQLIEKLTFGIKITWEEPYLAKFVSNLCDWSGVNDPRVSSVAVSVLANVCYQNEPVMRLLGKTVDVSRLAKFLISKKEHAASDVQICRFLLTYQCSKGTLCETDIHNYIVMTMKSFIKGIREVDENELKRVSVFFNDICCDPLTKAHVLSYDQYETNLQEIFKLAPGLVSVSNVNKTCLLNVFDILFNIVKLDLYYLRGCHKKIAEFCVSASNDSELSGPALGLLGLIISQYEEDGMLPDDLMPTVSMGFCGLLDPINLDPLTAGIDWVRFLCSLCDCHATREAVLINVNVEKFEDIFKQVLTLNQVYRTQDCHMRNEQNQELVLMGCYICLSLLSRSTMWEACFHRILSNASVQKIFNGFVSGTHTSQRKYFFKVIRHGDFPLEKINYTLVNINNDTLNKSNDSIVNGLNGSCSAMMNQKFSGQTLSASQERAVDELLSKISDARDNEKMNALNDRELYRCKINNLENRLTCSNNNLECANKTITSLNHTMAVLDATNKKQDEMLYQTQLLNNRLEENCIRYTNQISDAEKTIKKLQGKLAAERLEREQQFNNLRKEYTAQTKEMEEKFRESTEKMMSLQEQINTLELTKNSLIQKLEDMTKKNGDLANVLVKFEDKVKQKDKKLEESNEIQSALKSELEQTKQNMKALEKTLLERDKRLAQVTTQLDEMHRIQEMIASLMSNKTSTNVSNNNSN